MRINFHTHENEPLPSSPLLTRIEAASYLNVRPQTLAVWATTGRYGLQFIRIGRSVRYRQEDLDQFIAQRTGTSTQQIDSQLGG